MQSKLPGENILDYMYRRSKIFRIAIAVENIWTLVRDCM